MAVSATTAAVAGKVAELRADYERQGFTVVSGPGPGDVPFDTRGYSPDLLASRGDEHYLVEVRDSGTRLSADLLSEVAEEVAKHPGWHFLLITPDDVPGVPGIDEPLASWPRLRRRAATAVRLAESGGDPEVALLALWAALEGVLRKTAQRVSLPVERLPTPTLIRHLFSHGELSMAQFDRLMEACGVRSRIAHGHEAPARTVAAAVRDLVAVLCELLPEAAQRAA
jgi:REase_AHJR-like protein